MAPFLLKVSTCSMYESHSTSSDMHEVSHAIILLKSLKSDSKSYPAVLAGNLLLGTAGVSSLCSTTKETSMPRWCPENRGWPPASHPCGITDILMVKPTGACRNEAEMGGAFQQGWELGAFDLSPAGRRFPQAPYSLFKDYQNRSGSLHL